MLLIKTNISIPCHLPLIFIPFVGSQPLDFWVEREREREELENGEREEVERKRKETGKPNGSKKETGVGGMERNLEDGRKRFVTSDTFISIKGLKRNGNDDKCKILLYKNNSEIERE